MNITTVIVATSMAGMIAPGIANMAIQPVLASKRAVNFSAAEASAVIFSSTAERTNVIDQELLPDTCELTDNGDLAYTVSCTEVEGMFVQNVKRSFRLQDDDFAGIRVTTDIDADGFDDTTGLPTHYWECYSGWKGVGSIKNNCDLGGPYVIPAYAHLYN